MQNVQQTIISQYANAPSLTALIDEWNDAIDPSEDLQQFYADYWNILTAVGAGLDNWGIILGVSRALTVTSAAQYFGFYDGMGDWLGFGQAPFYSAGTGNTDTVLLADAQYLQLLLTKAAANICRTTIQALSRLVQNLFGSYGPCYVADLGNMQMAYVFGFTLTPVQYAIVATSGVLPHPTGVQTFIIQNNPGAEIGFVGSPGVPLSHGILNLQS